MKRPPRPLCQEEPCSAWEQRQGYCGHEIVNGPGSCLYDDPERMAALQERLRRKAMMGGKKQ